MAAAEILPLLPSSGTYPATTKAPVSQHTIGVASYVIHRSDTNEWTFNFEKLPNSSGGGIFVTSLTTAPDDSIVAAAGITSDGDCIIALLKVSDGSVIVTRKLPCGDHTGGLSAVSVRYVTRTETATNVDKSSLEYVEHKLVILTQYSSSSNVWLVQYCVNTEGAVASPKGKEMSVEPIIFQIPSSLASNESGAFIKLQVNALCSHQINGDYIRFIMSAWNGDGGIFVADYDCTTKVVSMVQSPSNRQEWNLLSKGETCCISSSCGSADSPAVVQVDNFEVGSPLFVFLKKKNLSSQVEISWISIETLSFRGKYIIDFESKISKIDYGSISIVPVASFDPTKVVSIAVLRKTSIKIVQLFRQDEQTLGKPRTLYHIPISNEHRIMELCSLASPYSLIFSCVLTKNNSLSLWNLFKVNSDLHPVGKFNYLLAKENFDEADELIDSIDSFANNNSFGSIHGSHVSLANLTALLRGNRDKLISNSEKMQQAKDCLRRLAAGAISGGAIGMQSLVQACKIVYKWDDITHESESPTLFEIKMALIAICEVISNVLSALSQSDVPEIVNEQRKLESKFHAVIAIDTIQSSIDPGFSKRPLPLKLLACRSISDVYIYYVLRGDVASAEKLRLYQPKDSNFTIDNAVVVKSIVTLRNETFFVEPSKFATWIEKFVIPEFSINDCDLLKSIRSWACEMADQLEERRSLSDVINFLKSICKASSVLSSRLLAYPSKHIISLCSTTDINSSTTEYTEQSPGPKLLGSSPNLKSVGKTNAGNQEIVSPPSIFQLEGLSSKPSRPMSSIRRDEYENEDCEQKLSQAIMLYDAKELGLSRSKATAVINLRNLDAMGGSETIAVELLRVYCESIDLTAESSLAINIDKISQFCSKHTIDFHHIIDRYSSDLSSRRDGSLCRSLQLIVTLARACKDNSHRCAIGIKALQNALICPTFPPNEIDVLSNDMLEWSANDFELFSQIQEASRLLKVNKLLREYCGHAAIEYFRVAEPDHSLRFLHFLCRFVDKPNILQDTFSLCDAFTHMSKVDAGFLLIQNIISISKENDEEYQRRHDQGASFLKQIYQSSFHQGNELIFRLLILADDNISNIRSAFNPIATCAEKKNMQFFSNFLCHVLTDLIESNVISDHREKPSFIRQLGFASWKELLLTLRRVSLLQKDYDVYVSCAELQQGLCHNQTNIVDQIFSFTISFASEWCEDNSKDETGFMKFKLLISEARRGFKLLFGESAGDKEWFKSIEAVSKKILSHPSESSRTVCVEFLNICGVLKKQNGPNIQKAVASTITAVVKTLCLKGASFAQDVEESHQREPILKSMRYIIQAVIILEEYALINLSEGECIASLMGLQNLSELLTNVILRSDAGLGEEMDLFLRRYRSLVQHHRRQCTSSISNLITSVILSKPLVRLPLSSRINSSWYIGDGLLLPPIEALKQSMKFCSSQISASLKKLPSKLYADPNFPADKDDLYSFLSCRGALNLALRVAVSNFSYGAHYRNVDETLVALAERSLGSSGSGIVSGNVDSQLAVTHLTSLSMKKAFKIYGSALPIAINKRDFQRLVILSRVGIQLCSEGRLSLLPKGIGWSSQTSFVTQCTNLEENSYWWNILQTLGVQFEPKRFDREENANNKARVEYASSLMPSIIRSASMSFYYPETVLTIAQSFSEHFGCDPYLAPQKLIEYLLSWPNLSSATEKDTRLNLELCERSCRKALLLLPSSTARSAVLRRCVIALEASDDLNCGRDYEKHYRVLAMYRSALVDVLEQNLANKPNTNPSSRDMFNEEFARIDRRNDTLAILISAFSGIKDDLKPSYPKLFIPLPNPFGSNHGIAPLQLAGVIETKNDILFDPLKYFKRAFSEDSDGSLTQALAAVSIPLGFPSGFVQARSLQASFEIALKKERSFTPPIDTVITVAKKLVNPSDGATFLSWCSELYQDFSDECMQCIELAHSLALKSSNNAERDRSLSETSSHEYSNLLKREKRALQELKRLGDRYASLSDTRMVNRILCDFSSIPGTVPDVIKSILTNIVTSIKLDCDENEFVHMPPEIFVEKILSQASYISSNKVLDGEISTMQAFRIIAQRVHAAAKSLDNKYSHVHVGHIAKSLSKRWLLHGEGMASTEIKSETIARNDTPNGSFDEDDTVNFVMDLKLLTKSNFFTEDIGCDENSSSKGNIQVTVVEEPSIIASSGSMREKSDASLSRSALRIAFVISFAQDYFEDDQGNISSSENIEPNRKLTNARLLRSSKFKPKVPKIDTFKRHAEDLLKIVFMNANLLNSKVHETKRDPLSTKHYCLDKNDSMKTITFSMRRRALEAVLILCPRAIIDLVISDEGYLKDTNCTLEKCAYALFIASEVEEMGLSLPHSDLIHLSMMDRSSYARALWRDYGRNENTRISGRLRLLLIDLCVSHGKIDDESLIVSVLSDLSRLKLNRSLLFGLEYTVKSRNICTKVYKVDKDILQTCFRSVFDATRKEIIETYQSTAFNAHECISVLSRLSRFAEMLHIFCFVSDDELSLVAKSIVHLCSIFNNDQHKHFRRGIIDISISLLRLLGEDHIISTRNALIDEGVTYESIMTEMLKISTSGIKTT